MAMSKDQKRKLFAELKHIADETRQFKPPYIPACRWPKLAHGDETRE